MRLDWNRALAGLVVAAVFLAGALTGAAAYRILGSPETAPSEPAPVREDEADRREDARRGDRDRAGERERRGPVYALSRILHEELDLTPRQERRVEEILEDRRRSAETVFDEMRSRFRGHLDSTTSEVKGALTEEQADEFERLLERMKEERRRARGARGGSGASEDKRR